MERRRLNRAEIKDLLYRRRYLVPNAVTVGNMFCGFLSVVYAASGRFEKAAIAIFVAIILDGLDGRVARGLNATSKFGVEYDSFSDLISFGIAPAMLFYHWGLQHSADEFGVLVTFIYAVCAASRLARFNIAQENLKSFVGLPSPGAAAAAASVINFMPRIEEQTSAVVALCAAVMVGLGYLMVCRIEFFSIKKLRIKGLRRGTRIAIAAFIGLLWYRPQMGVLVISFAYALSGPVSALVGKKASELSKG